MRTIERTLTTARHAHLTDLEKRGTLDPRWLDLVLSVVAEGRTMSDLDDAWESAHGRSVTARGLRLLLTRYSPTEVSRLTGTTRADLDLITRTE